MPFVENTPTRVEDLYRLSPPGNDAFMEASLEDGTSLYLSDGFAKNYPSPWPLVLHSDLAPPSVIEWMEERFAEVMAWLRGVSPHSLDRNVEQYESARAFFGPYLSIGGLEIGGQPFIYRDVAAGPDWTRPKTKNLRMIFVSPIIAFNPLIELPDNYPTP